jgi:hypothetical protein
MEVAQTLRDALWRTETASVGLYWDRYMDPASGLTFRHLMECEELIQEGVGEAYPIHFRTMWWDLRRRNEMKPGVNDADENDTA